MKKVLIAVTLVSVLMLSGCGKDNKKADEYEKSMKEYATHYYENFAHKGIDTFTVDIAALKKAKEKNLATYDLDKLKKCQDDSKAIISVDKEDGGKIKEIKFEMNCSK